MKILLFSLMMFFSITMFAQQIEHIVKPKETLSKLSKKYNTSKKVLKEVNPQLKIRKPQVGEKLIIYVNSKHLPIKTIPKEETITEDKDKGIVITIEKKESLYGLSKKYNVPIAEILRLNPGLSPSGPIIGEKIKLPTNARLTETPQGFEETKPIDEISTKSNEINIALFLPFDFKDTNSNIFKVSKNFLYGVKLALDSLSQEGLAINLTVVNTADNFENKLYKFNFSSTDLIVGPLYKTDLLLTLNNPNIKNIPIVSPFANGAYLDSYSNIILYEPRQKFYVESLISQITKHYDSSDKIYVIYDSNQTELAYLLRSTLNKQLKKADIILSTDSNIIPKDEKSINILISQNDHTIFSFLENVNKISIDSQLYSLFYSPLFEKNDFKKTLKKLNLIYTDSKYIDETNQHSIKTIQKYTNERCITPDQYAIMGFDSTHDIIKRLSKSGNFIKSNMKTENEELSNSYSFERIKNGAWINKKVRIIKF